MPSQLARQAPFVYEVEKDKTWHFVSEQSGRDMTFVHSAHVTRALVE